jgi:hypothetical protein
MAVEQVGCRSWSAGQRIEEQGGRKRPFDVREVLNGLFYVLWTGCQRGSKPAAQEHGTLIYLELRKSAIAVLYRPATSVRAVQRPSEIEAKLEVPLHAQTEVNNEVKPSAR